MLLVCFKCLATLQVASVEALLGHLKYIHGIHSGTGTKLVCMQDNCYATFNKVFCFKRHLLEIHCREETNVSNCHGEVHAIVAGTGQPEMPAVCNIEDSSGGDNDIGDMDLDEQIEEDMDVDVISDAIITFIATLKSYNSIPYSASNEIVNQVRELLKTVVMTLKKKTEKKTESISN